MRKEYDFSKAKRGAVVAVPKGKTRITIRIEVPLLLIANASLCPLRAPRFLTV